MSTKQWLNRVCYIDRRIDAKAEQAMRIRARLEGRRAILSDMPRGSSGTDWTDILAKLIDLEKEIDHEIDGLIKARREIVRAIDALPDERMRTIMEHRYLNGWSWDRIIDDMKEQCSERTVYEDHGRALQKISEKLQGTAVNTSV